MNAVLEELGKIGIVPVIKIDDVEKAVPLARALIAGGIPCAEITFRTAQGEEAIRRIVKEVPDILIGAGTVLNIDQVDRALAAGAKFIVSPGLNPTVVAHCIQKGIPITPGCANPSDIEQALEFGLEVVKFFPAEQAGGLDYIKAIAAPYPNLKFMPTGGINAGNIARYIAFDKILACGGSWMASAELINANDFEKITALSREAVLSLLNLHVAHIGINAGEDEAAMKAAKFFCGLFGFTAKDGNASIFAGDNIEIMKKNGLGRCGHIAIGTASVTRAAVWLERHGITFDYENAKKDPQGNVIALYLKEEVLGFAMHLVHKK
ncbi:MAG: bifunctional 4-hydroxy-2-oxoglutarate aldolase/2-dehydro-3-deoxy-phosphogluconate aldolase [Treponema sp.]|jgi:2-dehydro-3-deoxyphosphogluconate aldolase/(4S)-4-hydroxy-2-oxoglutarate aldolase|nr:bifunctional 4-hydroxy-2-oxoglutarate aldolase/2-dehydro-3-deoxy-phosphogluconate aldolase [Treponema sp.]